MEYFRVEDEDGGVYVIRAESAQDALRAAKCDAPAPVSISPLTDAEKRIYGFDWED